MQTPTSYTLLGIALALGALSLVGVGGVNWWYLWERNNNGGYDEAALHGASAKCSSSVDANDPLGVGLDLVLSQDVNSNQVTASGLVVGGGVRDGVPVQLRLSSAMSCNPTPSVFTSRTTVTPTSNYYADVDWTITDARLDGTGNDITGDVIVAQTTRSVPLACCPIVSLPGASSTSQRL